MVMGEYRVGTFVFEGCVYEIYSLGEQPTAESIADALSQLALQLAAGQSPVFDGNIRVVQTAACPRIMSPEGVANLEAGVVADSGGATDIPVAVVEGGA